MKQLDNMDTNIRRALTQAVEMWLKEGKKGSEVGLFDIKPVGIRKTCRSFYLRAFLGAYLSLS